MAKKGRYLKIKNWGLHKVNSQMIMDFGFENIMMNHIASEIISIIAQEQKMYEKNPTLKDRLTTKYAGDCIRRVWHIVNSKIENGIQIETVQKKQGSSAYFLKITGDQYLANRLTPWPLDEPEEYLVPDYTWSFDDLTGTGSYIFNNEKEGKTA